MIPMGWGCRGCWGQGAGQRGAELSIPACGEAKKLQLLGLNLFIVCACCVLGHIAVL